MSEVPLYLSITLSVLRPACPWQEESGASLQVRDAKVCPKLTVVYPKSTDPNLTDGVQN